MIFADQAEHSSKLIGSVLELLGFCIGRKTLTILFMRMKELFSRTLSKALVSAGYGCMKRKWTNYPERNCRSQSQRFASTLPIIAPALISIVSAIIQKPRAVLAVGSFLRSGTLPFCTIFLPCEAQSSRLACLVAFQVSKSACATK